MYDSSSFFPKRGGHWDFRFCGFGYFLDWFFGFCVHCGLQFLSNWFSVFIKNASGFSVLVSDVLFGFSYFVLFGFRFLVDLSGNSPVARSGHMVWL